MALPVPNLDDRRFDDLVEDLVARIPAHTPEWTDPRLGDPGRTLIELFAWLGDALLYRATGKLWTAVIAHAVTNGALGVWVVASGQWQFW